jgi:hypothetical protein
MDSPRAHLRGSQPTAGPNTNVSNVELSGLGEIFFLISLFFPKISWI